MTVCQSQPSSRATGATVRPWRPTCTVATDSPSPCAAPSGPRYPPTPRSDPKRVGRHVRIPESAVDEMIHAGTVEPIVRRGRRSVA